jgi:hypothetical protein
MIRVKRLSAQNKANKKSAWREGGRGRGADQDASASSVCTFHEGNWLPLPGLRYVVGSYVVREIKGRACSRPSRHRAQPGGGKRSRDGVGARTGACCGRGHVGQAQSK